MSNRSAALGHAGSWTLLACLLLAAFLAAGALVEPAPRSARPGAVARGESGSELVAVAARASRAPHDAAFREVEPAPAAAATAATAATDRPASHELDARREFLSLGALDPAALDARAAAILDDATPAAVRLAFVRACLDLGTPGRLRAAHALLRPKTRRSTPKDESLAQAAVRFLGDTAEDDPRARDMIRSIAFEEPSIAGPVRVRAAREFARAAAGRDLEALEHHLAAETDPLLISSALEGLAANPDTLGARRVAERLSLELPPRSEEVEP